MKIVTWNVNSIKSRLEHLQKYLGENSPDVVLLQELKCVDEAFPAMEIEDLGYNIAVHGQKTYNGVAILSKHPIEDVRRGLPGDDADEQARYIEAVIGEYRIVNIYVPNGQAPDSDKFQYKMRFYDRLRAHIAELLTYEEKLIIGADYNVAPADLDVYDPAKARGSVCFHPQEHRKFESLINLGLTDAFRALHPNEQKFSWWDYRAGSFQKNEGLRIDHLLLSPQAADKLLECDIDMQPRAWQKPSDHAPVWVEID